MTRTQALSVALLLVTTALAVVVWLIGGFFVDWFLSL